MRMVWWEWVAFFVMVLFVCNTWTDKPYILQLVFALAAGAATGFVIGVIRRVKR
jgi:ribose/xylose/arabinose/galactoside ABC-type transport system permease subunit